MFERIKAIMKVHKTVKLVEVLRNRETIDEDERAALVQIVSFYFYGGIRKKEDLFEYINDFYHYLYDSSPERENLKQVRRASTRPAYSAGFRERIVDFCLDYLIPFSEDKSFFEIRRLHKKFNKNYRG